MIIDKIEVNDRKIRVTSTTFINKLVDVSFLSFDYQICCFELIYKM
jgi:hypothetical protein